VGVINMVMKVETTDEASLYQ